MCTSQEEIGPAFDAAYTVCRATLAQVELWRGMTAEGKKKLPNADAYLFSTRTRER